MRIPIVVLTVILSFIGAAGKARAQGSLVPSGPPGPTMKTLQQIEPRVDLTTLPGNAYSQYLITNPGSYYLTTNVMGVDGKNAIRIETDNVTLDLGGFVLQGNGGVFGAIFVTRAQRGLRIQNGTFTGWSGSALDAHNAAESCFSDLTILDTHSTYGTGLQVGSNCTLRAVQVCRSGYFGIFAGENCRIIDCHSYSNRTTGFQIGARSQVSGCYASFNGNSGFFTGEACVLESCVADANGYRGIDVGNGAALSHCTAGGNTNVGIALGNGGVARECAARANGSSGFGPANGCTLTGCSAIANKAHGFSSSVGSVLRGCVARENLQCGIINMGGGVLADNDCSANGSGGGNAGIYAQGSGCRIEGNNLTGNNPYGLQVTSAGNFIIRNSASANTNNFNMGSGNTYGPIQTGTGAITNLNPWTNFSY